LRIIGLDVCYWSLLRIRWHTTNHITIFKLLIFHDLDSWYATIAVSIAGHNDIFFMSRYVHILCLFVDSLYILWLLWYFAIFTSLSLLHKHIVYLLLLLHFWSVFYY